MLRHPDLEVGAAERRVGGHRVFQRHEVKSLHVVAVRLVNFLRQSPALDFVAEPQQIARELGLGRQILRVEFNGLTLPGRPLGKPILPREFFPDPPIHPRVVRPGPQRPIAGGPLVGRVVTKVRQHRPQSPGVRLVGVDREHIGEILLGLGIAFPVDGMIGPQQKTGRMAGIRLQRLLQRRQHGLAVAFLMRPRQPVIQVRIGRPLLQAFLIRRGCQRKVVLLQSQFTARKIDVAQTGRGFLRGRVNLRQHNLRIRAQKQGRPAEDHEIGSRTISRRPVRIKRAHHAQIHGSLLGFAVGKRHLAPEPLQPEALRQSAEALP